ncbi:adenosylcobinamide-GDP ribazoletransferase [Silanimonas sp.]|uniref:adenosylcobinamide-GDP ribazoletransferase n=1 Tax=Silanimonas sp. TaxID=1929290 RepID=UPI0022BFA734|nr:adenosylcobinamide-GDP ribazoletransferase [Silanimonas sp.]MCZ8165907.1 adenosylcobinamide-GDP ribazoletransferase [Silanimonas sp.]
MSIAADAPASIGPIRREWRGFWLAVQFFTRLPTPQFEGFRAEWLNDAAKWFPAVGLLVGGLSAAVLWLAAQVFPMPIAAGLALAAGAVVTGAFHEDGLADTFDALGGHVDRAKALVIMKDSRLGSYGALALLLVTGLRWGALAALPLALAIPALVAAHAVARGGATALMARLDYVRDEDGKSKPLAVALGPASLLVALLLSALPLGVATGLAPDAWPLWAAGTAAVALVHEWCARWYRRRLGGFTGDTLGCAEQLGEAAFLLAAVAALRLLPGGA